MELRRISAPDLTRRELEVLTALCRPGAAAGRVRRALDRQGHRRRARRHRGRREAAPAPALPEVPHRRGRQPPCPARQRGHQRRRRPAAADRRRARGAPGGLSASVEGLAGAAIMREFRARRARSRPCWGSRSASSSPTGRSCCCPTGRSSRRWGRPSTVGRSRPCSTPPPWQRPGARPSRRPRSRGATAALTVTYLAPATGEVRAVAQVLSRGRSLVTVDAAADCDGKAGRRAPWSPTSWADLRAAPGAALRCLDAVAEQHRHGGRADAADPRRDRAGDLARSARRRRGAAACPRSARRRRRRSRRG